MATVRIRGKWSLVLAKHEGGLQPKTQPLADGVLEINKVTRASLGGEILIDGQRAFIVGKVKPGSPAIVTLTEADGHEQPIEGGLEAVLYIPPWWPNLDYSYDYITGTLVVGDNSKLGNKSLRSGLITVSGIQAFE